MLKSTTLPISEMPMQMYMFAFVHGGNGNDQHWDAMERHGDYVIGAGWDQHTLFISYISSDSVDTLTHGLPIFDISWV